MLDPATQQQHQIEIRKFKAELENLSIRIQELQQKIEDANVKIAIKDRQIKLLEAMVM